MKPEEPNNFYKPEAADTKATAPPATPKSSGTITWTASEYIDHERGPSWYGLLVLGTILLAGVIYLVTKDYFATGTIIVLGIIVGVSVGRKPQQITFELSPSGLRAGQKTYNYNLFKSFSIIREGNLVSLSLTPLKRLMPPVSAYFDPADEQKITNAVGEHLPYEHQKPGAVDRLTFRLRM